MLQINEVNTKSQFYKMRKTWNKTLNNSLENSIFLTWEKMAPSVNQIKEKNSLKILCASEAGKIVGIAPFRKTTKSLKGKVRLKIIEPLTNGDTDYTGMILPNNKVTIISKFLDHLLKQKDWDLMQIPDLPQSSTTLELIKKASKHLLNPEIKKGVICPYVILPESKQKLLASLGKKFRKNLVRRIRKLEREQGKVEIKQYHEIGSLNYSLNVLFELHQKRWNIKTMPGRFISQKERNTTIKTAKYFAKRNWLRFYFLTVNNNPVAAELNFEYKGKMYGHLSGFDPKYSIYGVGNLLTLKILEECIKKRISEYDFMQGSEPYKFQWTDKYRQNIDVVCVNMYCGAHGLLQGGANANAQAQVC